MTAEVFAVYFDAVMRGFRWSVYSSQGEVE